MITNQSHNRLSGNQTTSLKFPFLIGSQQFIGLEIIFGHSLVKRAAKYILARSYLVSDRTNINTYFLGYKVHITKILGHKTCPELKKNFLKVYFNHN